jgi:hypothetical protein
MNHPTEVSHAPELRPGGHNDAQWVEYLQRLLMSSNNLHHNFGLHIDGDYGAKTQTAVRRFQEWVPLPVTGVCDTATWAAAWKNAQAYESVDETLGQMAGDERAAERGAQKLAAGYEIERKGWKCAQVRYTLYDYRGLLIPNGQAYARFIAADGAQSDEGHTIDDGSVEFHNVWVPDDNGRMWFYLNSPHLGELQGETPMDWRDGVIDFTVHQDFDTKQTTVSDAVEHGWMHGGSSGATVSTGINVAIVEIGGEIKGETTWSGNDKSEYGLNETMTVRIPKPNLTVKQTG